ncbi:MAG TPA: PAS domain-containing protein [Deltaproteobacteria bacterium]|nr:PAS domain-containing protein [Deltaproteobacteria bacterium]
MADREKDIIHDFKGIGFSKIGYFKEVQSKIKELEKLNVELAKRHTRLEAIFNSMSDGLTILDKGLNIVFANQVQKNMFPDTSLIGKKCFKTYFRREKVCRDCPSLRTLESRETLQGETLVKSGEYAGRYFEWTTSPIKGPSNTVEEIIYLMRDITPRKEFEHKLVQTDRMAAIGFLAAGIAHEINNPLTSIAGFSEGLLKRLKNIKAYMDDIHFKSFREYLDIIQSEAYRCKDIIQNLQEFSRSSGDDYETIPIDRIIRDTISLFRQHAKDSGIKMNYKNHLSLGLNTISGKESQLKHLFLNLFDRAFKAMEKGGPLSLVSTNRGSKIEIVIGYNGGGPVHHFSSNIFNPSSINGGAGGSHAIDLSICYSIVRQHMGEIQFDADEDHNNRFTIRFPVCLQ